LKYNLLYAMLSGMQKHPKRPRDTNQIAKFIVDMATGGIGEPAIEENKDPAAVALGKKGGAARAAKLSKKKRSEIASNAAKKRWTK
jgi:hypothetical protein